VPAKFARDRILIFEDRAHDPRGHFGHLFFEVASELGKAGHEVHILTGEGWVSEDNRPPLPRGVVEVARMPLLSRLLTTVAGRGVFETSGIRLFSLNPLRFVATIIQQAALVSAIRHATRKLNSVDIPVIVLSITLRAPWAALLAPSRARWMVYEHLGPDQLTNPSPFLKWGIRLAAKIEQRRRARDGHIRIATNNQGDQGEWARFYPWLECEVVPSATARTKEPSPKATARRSLGIEGNGPLALHFGFPHEGKDLETVLEAFADDGALGHLVVAGTGTGDRLSRWLGQHPDQSLGNIACLDTFVDERQKDLLFSAADYVVLSMVAGRRTDSGILSDAASYRLPVCCSDDSEAARLVRSFKLGVIFSPGNTESLRRAAKSVRDFSVDDECFTHYLESRSPRAFAQRLLDLAARP